MAKPVPVTPVTVVPTPSIYKLRVAAFAPSTFAHVIALTLTITSAATVSKVVVVVAVKFQPALPP